MQLGNNLAKDGGVIKASKAEGLVYIKIISITNFNVRLVVSGTMRFINPGYINRSTPVVKI